MIRAALSLASVGLVFGACTMNAPLGSGAGNLSATGGSSGAAGNPSATGGSSGAAGSGPTDGGTPARCVSVDPSSYDQSCNQASDCVYVIAGQVCNQTCNCGNALINATSRPQYEQAIASIRLSQCFCPNEPVPQCIHHECVIPPSDAGTPASDAGACVNVDVSTYDQTCSADSDCMEVTGGAVCTGACACGGSAINVDGKARYEAAVAAVKPAQCFCPAGGFPRCVQNHCRLCGGPSGSCGDGG